MCCRHNNVLLYFFSLPWKHNFKFSSPCLQLVFGKAVDVLLPRQFDLIRLCKYWNLISSWRVNDLLKCNDFFIFKSNKICHGFDFQCEYANRFLTEIQQTVTYPSLSNVTLGNERLNVFQKIMSSSDETRLYFSKIISVSLQQLKGIWNSVELTSGIRSGLPKNRQRWGGETQRFIIQVINQMIRFKRDQDKENFRFGNEGKTF